MSVLQDEPLTSEITFFRADALKLLQAADPQAADYDSAAADRMLAAMEDAYQSLKAHLLRAGSEGRLRTEQMVELLEFYSRIRRLLQQAVKGARYLYRLLDLAAVARQKKDEATVTVAPAAEAPPPADKVA